MLVIAGLAFTKMARAVGVLRRHQLAIMRIGGMMLVAVGLLLVTGAWDSVTGAGGPRRPRPLGR